MGMKLKSGMGGLKKSGDGLGLVGMGGFRFLVGWVTGLGWLGGGWVKGGGSVLGLEVGGWGHGLEGDGDSVLG
ncbi:uncharacterized protein G2W53_026112 [Senna tora]|uniref:Uncharacterized protein n=1 Tax=Senna tora TaxID=362788 RepID=A0A834WFD7_9FABA|nr:uncharacterized protein G2W53_026112 [Senna tora]